MKHSEKSSGSCWNMMEAPANPIEWWKVHPFVSSSCALFIKTKENPQIETNIAQTSPATDGSFRLDSRTRSLKPRQAAFACRSAEKTTTTTAACCAAQTAGNRQQAAAPFLYREISDGKINFIWFTEQKLSQRRRFFFLFPPWRVQSQLWAHDVKGTALFRAATAS